MRGGYGAALGFFLLSARLPMPAASYSQSLDFTISVPREVRRDKPVPITLTLRNNSEQPIETHFLGRTIAFDIVVTTEDGIVVWQRLAEGTLPSILQVRTLAPGETLKWHATWKPKDRGRYRLQGILPSDAREPLRTAWAALLVKG